MSLTVTWYGHSNILLESSTGTISIDPFFHDDPEAWRKIPRPDMIALTHDHVDHLGSALEMLGSGVGVLACITDIANWLKSGGLSAEHIANNGSGWNIGGTLEFGGIKITMTPAVHSSGHGSPVGYILEFPDGFTVYHAGDTAIFGDMVLLGRQCSIDVAIVPIGGIFTMDGTQAAQACAMLNAKAAIPVHYGTFSTLAPDAEGFERALKDFAPQCMPLVLKKSQKQKLA